MGELSLSFADYFYFLIQDCNKVKWRLNPKKKQLHYDTNTTSALCKHLHRHADRFTKAKLTKNQE